MRRVVCYIFESCFGHLAVAIFNTAHSLILHSHSCIFAVPAICYTHKLLHVIVDLLKWQH